jgi:hypothetical protein
MEKFLEKLNENGPLVVVLLGVVAFALGAAGGIKTEILELPPIDPPGRVALAGIGLFIVVLGALLLWVAHHVPGNLRALKKDYGFRIEAPVPGQRATSPIEVRGSFQREPPDRLARVIEFIPANGSYYPKSRFVINAAAKTWSTNFAFGGTAGEQREFIVALCGPGGDALFEYHARVGEELGNWIGIRRLPPDVVLRERVKIEIG